MPNSLVSGTPQSLVVTPGQGAETVKYSQASQGRSFVIRLEDGDVLHEALERFAAEKGIQAALLIAVGGADSGSKLVVGPQEGRASPVVPMERVLDNVHEIAGVGTLFPDGKGMPKLHMHVSCGRESTTVTGCVRRGVRAWHVMEIVLLELVHTTARRKLDPGSGFELLEP
jgi:predicted DNA-binding protein with PD1-like motif